MAIDMASIRLAVCMHHAGFEGQPDDTILRLWSALAPDVQAAYLERARPHRADTNTKAQEQHESSLGPKRKG